MTRDLDALRRRMVETQIRARGVKDKSVLRAMAKVPRHVFVPDDMIPFAYEDEPLPIGAGQTISQPYIVGYMTEALKLTGEKRVLEIGTGSGYQTAVLAELADKVYTIELVEDLSRRAQHKLEGLGYVNIFYRIGDGSLGWPEQAPYDAIIVTAAPSSMPENLEEQLADSGRLIVPVGHEFQDLILVEKEGGSFRREKLIGVRFVPLKRGPSE